MTTSSPLLPPSLDPVAAHPELAELTGALAAGDWPRVSAFFAQRPDPNAQIFLARTVADTAGVEAFLERAVADGGGMLAQALLGARHINIGWDIRTGARAQYVTESQWQGFRKHLVAAERLLIEVTAHEPGNAAAWAMRLHTATGLSLGQSEAHRRYRELARHHPHAFLAQTRMIQQLCPKWGGTWDGMHAFARECLHKSPAGSLDGAVVAEGHLEQWLELQGGTAGAKYLAQPQVLAELTEAAARSVLHPEFRRGYGWVVAHGYFAMAFSLAGAYDLAAPHFQQLGNLLTEQPWAYLGDPAAEFTKHRAKALARGGRK
jgi:hypothetical protein